MTWELELLLWMQNLGIYKFLSPFMIVVTKLGDFGFVWLALVIYVGLYKKDRSKAMTLLVAMLCTAIVGNLVLKNVFMRPRPFVVYPYVNLLISTPSGYSFPSGHSSLSFTAAYVLSYFYPKKAKWVWTLASLVAFSRMFLFVHFPTDVFAGAILGIGCGYFAVCLYQNQWFSKFD